MKFQNSSIHGFKVMLCIKKRDERTDRRTDGRTDGQDGRTNNPEAICPSNFFEVGGIIKYKRAKMACITHLIIRQVSGQMAFQFKRRFNIDSEDGSHGSHLGFQIRSILTTFDLHIS